MLSKSFSRKLTLLVSLTCCASISSAETIDKIYARGGPNVASYVTTVENPNIWIDLESNWSLSSALGIAKASNHNNLTIVTAGEAPHQCQVGPRHFLRGELCADFRHMFVHIDLGPNNNSIPPPEDITDRVTQILFLHNAFTSDQFTNVSIPDTTGAPESLTYGFMTQNGDAVALAMDSVINGDKVTYVTECKWFNINGAPTRQCGWLREVVTN